MSDSDNNIPREASLPEKVVTVLAKARASVYGNSTEEPFVAQALDAIPATVKQSEDYAPAIAAIQQMLQATERLQAILRESLKEIEALEALRARRERYGERWWQEQSQELRKLFQQDSLLGVDRWLRLYTEALLAWELTICERLVEEAFLLFPPSADDLASLFQQGTQAIRAERYTDALSMLIYLLEAKSAKDSSPLFDSLSRMLLTVFIGRISLYHGTDRKQALAYFQQACELAPDDGRPLAALGDYYRAENEITRAQRFYEQAIEYSPEQPGGYVGLGLLAEAQKQWDEAEEWYEHAIETVRDEKDMELALCKLLAPVSGNLYLSLARVMARDEPERALSVIDRAIDLGIKAEGEYPEKLGYQLKGEILAALQKTTEAAEAYYKAGQRYSWDNQHQKAAEALAQAQTLNSSDARIYRNYADALRMQSSVTAPLNVDKKLIEKSLAVWEQGLKLELPDADSAWTYITRALINEQLVRLHDEQRLALYWEAIVYLHRAILLNAEDAYSWAYLGRFYNTLEQEPTALYVTGKALGYSEDDQTALDERSVILANTGEFAAAAELLDRRLKLNPDDWSRGVKAFVRFFQRRYDEALELIDQSMRSIDTIWNRNLRAICCLLLNQPSRAQEDYAWIWERHDEPDFAQLENQSDFAWAAYNLAFLSSEPNLLDQAIGIFETLRQDPTQRVNNSLGICLLTRGAPGDIEEGEKCLITGIQQANNTRELEGLLNHDLLLLEKRSSQLPHGEQVRAVLERVKPQIEAQHEKVKQARPDSAAAEMEQAEQELKQVIENPDRKGATNGWAELGALAQLAQIYTEQQRWHEATKTYQQILQLVSSQPDRFPEARLGWQRTLDELFGQYQTTGERLLEEGNPEGAREQFVEAHRFAQELSPDDKERESEWLARIGYAYFQQGDFANARTNFTRVLELYHAQNNSNAGGALGTICRSLLRDITHYWSLDDEWKAWSEESQTDDQLRHELIAARQSLATYLDELFQLSSQAGDTAQMASEVTPIAVEIEDSLIPEDTGPDSLLFKTLLPEMRERLQNHTGVRIPGVRIRGNESDLPPESYIIMLDEVPLVLGTTSKTKRYCPVSPDKLQSLGIPADDITETPHPLTGEPGCWVLPEHSELIRARGLELWDEPLMFTLYHLEAVLRRNLADFLGVQEVEELLYLWGQTERGEALIQAALPDAAARLRFPRLLSALVKERVSINSLGSIKSREEILTAVQSVGLTRDEIGDALRAVRLRLKPVLPGNQTTDERIELPADIEATINKWVWHTHDKTFFALPPEDTQELLSEIRALVDSTRRNLVLVTRSAEVRPFVRRLVELEFPDLMVIAQDELLPRETAPIKDGGTANA